MDGDTPRLIGYALGIATFGYFVLRLANLQEGYQVDRSRRCISKIGYEEITRQKRQRQ